MSEVRLTGPIGRKGASDTYPTHDNNKGLESFFVKDNITGRNAIPNDIRGTKCTCFVIDSDGSGTPGIYYIDDTTDITDNSNWTFFQSGVVSGGIIYQGNWNANTNSPALSDGTGTSGYFYVVDTAGSQDLGSGSQSFVIGDWVIYDGGIWRKLAQAGNTNDWDTMINKPSSFTPSSHTHPISEITDLQATLDGKLPLDVIDVSELTTETDRVPSSGILSDHVNNTDIHFEIDDGAVTSNKVWSSSYINTKFATDTLTPDQINTLIAGASTYGIRFFANSVSDPKENYSASATNFDYLLETDTRDVYQFVSSAWVLRYNLDVASVVDDVTMGGATPSGAAIPSQNAVAGFVRNIDEINTHIDPEARYIKAERVDGDDDQFIIHLDAVNGTGYLRFSDDNNKLEFSNDKTNWRDIGYVLETTLSDAATVALDCLNIRDVEANWPLTTNDTITLNISNVGSGVIHISGSKSYIGDLTITLGTTNVVHRSLDGADFETSPQIVISGNADSYFEISAKVSPFLEGGKPVLYWLFNSNLT